MSLQTSGKPIRTHRRLWPQGSGTAGAGSSIAAPGTDTDITGTSITISSDCTLRATIQVATATKVKIHLTRNSVEDYLFLNSGNQIPAGEPFTQDVPGFVSSDTVALQLDTTDSAVDFVAWDEVF